MNNRIMRTVCRIVLIFLLAMTCNSYLVIKVQAGGPIAITQSEIAAPDYQGYLGCSCDSGSLAVTFQNDDSVPLTVNGNGWSVGPIAAGETAEYSFVDPGTYTYTINNNASVAGKVTILNLGPKFPSGATLTASDISTDSLTLNWPAGTDDGPTITYKVVQDDAQIYSGSALTTKVTGLKANTSYTFKVQIYDATGYLRDGVEPSTTVTTKAATISSPPPSPKASATAKSTVDTTSPSNLTSSPAVSPSPNSTPDLTVDTKVTYNGDQVKAGTVYRAVKDPVIGGTTEPNTKVTVTVHSDPVTYRAIADSSGHWSVTIALRQLSAGTHTVDVGYAKDNIIGPTAESVITFEKKNTSLYWIAGIGMIIIAVLAGWLIWFARRKNKKSAHPLAHTL